MPLVDRPEFRILSSQENNRLIEKSRIIAVFVEVDDAYGLMVQGEGDGRYVTTEEKAALILAARNLPTRD